MVLKGKETRLGWDYNSHSSFVRNEEVRNLTAQLVERFHGNCSGGLYVCADYHS